MALLGPDMDLLHSAPDTHHPPLSSSPTEGEKERKRERKEREKRDKREGKQRKSEKKREKY